MPLRSCSCSRQVYNGHDISGTSASHGCSELCRCPLPGNGIDGAPASSGKGGRPVTSNSSASSVACVALPCEPAIPCRYRNMTYGKELRRKVGRSSGRKENSGERLRRDARNSEKVIAGRVPRCIRQLLIVSAVVRLGTRYGILSPGWQSPIIVCHIRLRY